MMDAISNTPVFRAKIDVTSSGDIVAAVAGKAIRVLEWMLTGTTAGSVKWQSGATSDLTGVIPTGANGGAAPGFSPIGNFQTVVGEKLNLVLSGTGQTGGYVNYQLLGGNSFPV